MADIKRANKIICEYRDKLNVDLKDYTVLTEVGSNYYEYAPIVPLICGSPLVRAFVKDTSFGNGEEIRQSCLMLASSLGLSGKIDIAVNNLPNEWLNESDIVTNSGMLRPFDETKISKFKKGAVLPLMFESWEIREQDLDVAACKNYNIKIAGTWENHPSLKIFDYVKMLCLKMVFEAGYEVMGNSIFIWSDDHFGEVIQESFLQNGANKCYLSTDISVLIEKVTEIDFIFISDYDESGNLFEILCLNELFKRNQNLGIIHLYGQIDSKRVFELGLNLFPRKNGYSNVMSYTLAHVGMSPYLKLQVAGYKVAQEMLTGIYTNLSQQI
jgi:hypothetical protein